MPSKIVNAEKIIKTSPLVLVDFYAEWCEPCQWLDPVLAETENKFKEKLIVVKTDVDEEKIFSEKNHVLSVPTLILFKNGKEAWREAGVPETAVLNRIIEKYI